MWGTLGEPSGSDARLNATVDVASATLRYATYEAGAHVPLHRHDCPSIVYGVGGPCLETRASPTSLIRRRLTFLPAEFSHTLDYAGPTQVFVLEASQQLAELHGLSCLRNPVPLPATLYRDIWSILSLITPLTDTAQLSAEVQAFWKQSALHLHLNGPPWLAPLLDRLHANWEKSPATSALAAELGFSPQFLCRAFKRATGVTLQQYNQAIRVDYARGLLWGSGVSISEVAGVTGFADQAHLTRALRQHSGVTPGQFRSHSFVPPAPLKHSYRLS